MRTTINLDDEVFKAYKQRAAERRTSFAHVVEDALRADLHQRRAAAATAPFQVRVFRGDDSAARIDVNDNRALEQLLDEEDRSAGRW
ncbi:hypothetical protein [Conexibacter sp. CPCC 206217]|uniref:hypothetical protein n=1 Tax=Conexibacter sp. CPCC 206217 TaxID=3064574 RepID=UPI002722BFA7|nr:hypothetical protein [Conexibacter sp. CPCC 206217]MDO8209815.1 hypothetical protein [Conexibacter sp. CPCC 206217]